jgi:hypothetical protein
MDNGCYRAVIELIPTWLCLVELIDSHLRDGHDQAAGKAG